MDLNQWKKAAEVSTAVLHTFLDTLFEKDYEVTLNEAETFENSEIKKHVTSSGKVLRLLEEHFQSEVFIKLNQAWVTKIEALMLNFEVENANLLNTVVKDFGNTLVEICTSALAEAGIDIKIGTFDIIDSDKLERSFNMRHYFYSSILATPAGADEHTEEEKMLELQIALSHPDKEAFSSYADSFDTAAYAEAAKRYAKHQDIVPKSQSAARSLANGSISSKKGREVEFEDFGQSRNLKNMRDVRSIDILKDVEMELAVELGRRKMSLGDILQLVKGSVIELEKLAGEPVEVLVNGYKIARGDVLVVDEHFGVRISNILAAKEHLKKLQ